MSDSHTDKSSTPRTDAAAARYFTPHHCSFENLARLLELEIRAMSLSAAADKSTPYAELAPKVTPEFAAEAIAELEAAKREAARSHAVAIPTFYCAASEREGGEHEGLIAGHNSSANFDVLFTSGPWTGKTLNVHPSEVTVLSSTTSTTTAR